MRRLIQYGTTSFEVVLLVALAVVEYLSDYHPILSQHLYFKKIEYLTDWYSGTPLYCQLGLAVVVTGAFLLLVKRHGGVVGWSFVKFLLFALVAVACFQLPLLQELNCRIYLLLVAEGCAVLEVVTGVWLVGRR